MPQVGHNIRTERQKLGMKQECLADRIGMTQSNLSKIENGEIGISVNDLEKVATELQVTIIVLHGVHAAAPADPSAGAYPEESVGPDLTGARAGLPTKLAPAKIIPGKERL